MKDRRQTRAIGSLLVLGGITYRVEAVEGCGGSAIVYRATYPDALNTDCVHQVFIKELFPVSDYGEITRDEQDRIVCTGRGYGILTEAQRRFRIGNQVNLELLRRMPVATAGNLNSFQAYGTYYSVLSLHGGENLLHRLNEEGALPVMEALRIMEQLLRELEVFHTHGLLHLDISADNLLLLPDQVFLIDFNSVWDTANPNEEDFCFSCKSGYSPPEVLLHNFKEISTATDLYACCAVFFHMLAGRRLNEQEARGELRRSLVRLPCLHDIPQTAAAKMAKILLQGLHPLGRKRYQSTGQLLDELQELSDRLEKAGVTQSALWEVSAAQQKAVHKSRWSYLQQGMIGDGPFTQDALVQQLEQGQCFLLTGPGGMGKSRLLYELWQQHTKVYRPDRPVYFYLALKDYQVCEGEGCFIRHAILQAMKFSPRQPCYADALHSLEELLHRRTADNRVLMVILLDGLNEAGTRREKLLAEIEMLGRCQGVGILLTERTDAVLGYALWKFSPIVLCPLSQQQVMDQLEGNNLAVPQAEAVRSLLTTPMMLFLYLEVAEGRDKAPELYSGEELVELYLKQFQYHALRIDSGDQGKQLCNRFLIQHLLPDIAAEMERQGKTVLQMEHLRRLARQSYQLLRSGSFGSAFPEYLGKSRLMFAGIGNGDEWYDFAVRERLTDQFGLLTVTVRGQYGVIHDEFLPVLARQSAQNQRQLAHGRLQQWRRRAMAICIAMLILCVTAAAGTHYVQNRNRYTAQEHALIYDSISLLSMTLNLWSNRVASQEMLLKRAAGSDVLDNQDAFARDSLRSMIQQQRRLLASQYVAPLEPEMVQSLDVIAQGKSLFSPALLQQLCTRSGMMERTMDQGMAHLEAVLCDGESAYDTRDKRERVVKVYQDYLHAEVRYMSYLLAALLHEMTPEQQEQITSAITYMEALDEFYDGPGSVDPARLSDGTARALDTLMQAQREMNAQGFSIQWE